jgi:hypothetical protein
MAPEVIKNMSAIIMVKELGHVITAIAGMYPSIISMGYEVSIRFIFAGCISPYPIRFKIEAFDLRMGGA